MNKLKKILLHVIMPMMLGGIIYIIFRDNNTLMFSWFYKLGIAENIENIRNVIEINFLPNWILFNFPDGVWIYSLTSLMFPGVLPVTVTVFLIKPLEADCELIV